MGKGAGNRDLSQIKRQDRLALPFLFPISLIIVWNLLLITEIQF
jgi:hypothetical protein